MKRHKYWIFTSDDGSESWWGDCPRWAAETRRFRTDLRQTVGIAYGARAACSGCVHGHR